MSTERRFISLGLHHLILNEKQGREELQRRSEKEKELHTLLEAIPEDDRERFAFEFRKIHKLPVTTVDCNDEFVLYLSIYANGTIWHPDVFDEPHRTSAWIEAERRKIRELFTMAGRDYDAFFDFS